MNNAMRMRKLFIVVLLLAAFAPGFAQPCVVLMGDSITEIWPENRPLFFEGTGIVGRGISGQVSAQMLLLPSKVESCCAVSW